jgi:glycosyltransferase involved in cell wall biosynthesis
MSAGDQSPAAIAPPPGLGQVSEPSVSVVIPCYNQAHFLAEAIESALAQEQGQIEIVVVDDGSTDNAGEISKRYPKVRYLRQENRGAAAARNTGIAASSGEFLVFLDADDRLLPGAVDAGVQAFRGEPAIACAIGACRDIGPGGEALGTPDQVLVHRDHYLALLRSCFVLSGSSVLFSRWCLEALDGFEESYVAGDDYDLYLRIARRFPIECHGRIVTEYRRHADSLTQDPIQTMKGELGALRAQRGAVAGGVERTALKAGRRRARRTHAGALRRRLFEQVGARDWTRALRSAAALARSQPTALIDALGDLRAARRVAGAAGGR